jgi:GNAT superfamily N-acetyltransferase
MMRDYNCYSVKDCETKNPGSIRVNPMDFKSLDGVEGVALGVDPDYKGLGVGKKLLEYSQRLPYDYIWGQQYESLGNIEHWTKRREIAAYFPGLWLTYAFL